MENNIFKVEKNTSSTVYINTPKTSWAIFMYTPKGDLFLSSDWGTYSHQWRSFGGDFENFLKGLGVGYFVGKLSTPDINQKRISKMQQEILTLLVEHFINALKNQQPEKPNLELKQEIISKANKWDELHEKIGKIYYDENFEGDLTDIGEIAALKLGYLI